MTSFKGSTSALPTSWEITNQYKGLTFERRSLFRVGSGSFFLVQSASRHGELLTAYSTKQKNGSVAPGELLTQTLMAPPHSDLNFEIRNYLVLSEPVRISCRTPAPLKGSSWSSIEQLVRTKKIIFVGEQHGGISNLSNRDELFAAIARTGRRVELILEMFRQADQDSINKYLEGKLDVGGLAQAVNWTKPAQFGWGWPFDSYSNLLENARSLRYGIWGADNNLRDKEEKTDVVLRRALSESPSTYSFLKDFGDIQYRDAVMAEVIRKRISASGVDDLIVVYTGSEHAITLPMQMAELRPADFAQVLLGAGRTTSISQINGDYTLAPIFLAGDLPNSYRSKNQWVLPLFRTQIWISFRQR